MLQLTRKPGETIVIGDDIRITVMQIAGGAVRVGIEAPRAVPVYREELWLAVREENQAAAQAAAQTELPPLSAARRDSAGG
jgi:carbon storage regulator